ncbi:hypothetical protein [Lacicoccus alkaliphilus]|uniref:Uncharacterized protein n=1 Tax=Lacicoccus alkaliphilus DSM 16010 TaxID=1123231 RepID=A0A1M7G1V4_9BACL|nr:hypothetical protein [Salinicoccus alkaliphilus]SHM09869.1 hypothetical protein SAMN02745189_01544 [Salinicoccus alkaliphilus DSM 16010]
MDIKCVEATLKDDLETYYYPNQLAVWKVTFRTLLFTRKELVVTYGDAVTGNIGIVVDVPDVSSMEADEAKVIPRGISDDAFHEKSREALRKYFIYKRRVWKIPKIECDYVDSFFVPYQVEERTTKSGDTKYYLYEPLSNMYEELKKHKVIKSFVLGEGEIKV